MQVICAAEGQHEEHTVFRSPVRDVVNKNSTEPHAAHLEGFWVKMWLILLNFGGSFWFLRSFAVKRGNLGNGGKISGHNRIKRGGYFYH